MAGFSNSEFIENKTPEEVFAFMIDPKNAPKIISEVKSSRKLTEGEIGLGTRFLETRVVRGKEGRAELKITHFIPNEEYSVSSTEGVGDDVTGLRVDLDGDGGHVRVHPREPDLLLGPRHVIHRGTEVEDVARHVEAGTELEREAAEVAATMITACTKCLAHFRCLMEEPDKMEGLPELKIVDFTEFVAGNLKEGS